MATQSEEIILRMGMNTDAVSQGIAGVNAKMQHFGKSIMQVFSASMVLGAINRVIDKFDDLQDRAENLSVSTDFLQGMEQLARSGAVGGANTFNKSIAELSTRLGLAKNANKEAVETFQKYGITVKDIARLDAEGMFFRIADAVRAIPDPAQRTAAAFELLGKSGKNMAGLLANGKDRLQEMAAAVEKLSSAEVAELGKAKDNIEGIQNYWMVKGGKALNAVAYAGQFWGRVSTGEDTIRKSAEEEAIRRNQELRRAEYNASQERIAAYHAQIALQRKLNEEVRKQVTDLYARRNKIQSGISAHNFVSASVEEIAGRDWAQKWSSQYGQGGQFDTGAGTGRLRLVAQEFIRAREAQRYARTMGWDGLADKAQERMNKAEGILAKYGAIQQDPVKNLADMKKELIDVNTKLANLAVTIKGTE